ncbi:hypothetical protein T484DRAFT_1760909 [Baffinella frigidus]|nr:hypothetical protein T484DRAFT_1760909 [Cryptophyta sp. CCMP2293]
MARGDLARVAPVAATVARRWRRGAAAGALIAVLCGIAVICLIPLSGNTSLGEEEGAGAGGDGSRAEWQFRQAQDQIRQGGVDSRAGRFEAATARFLRGKDLWRSSGVKGWQSVQGLADGSVERNEGDVRDGLWTVQHLSAANHQPSSAAGADAATSLAGGERSTVSRGEDADMPTFDVHYVKHPTLGRMKYSDDDDHSKWRPLPEHLLPGLLFEEVSGHTTTRALLAE